jgi:hypothetical protein
MTFTLFTFALIKKYQTKLKHYAIESSTAIAYVFHRKEERLEPQFTYKHTMKEEGSKRSSTKHQY